MARDFRPDARESAVISKLDHAKESQRIGALHLLRTHIEFLSDRIVMKLLEDRLVETSSRLEMENQIHSCLENLLSAEEYDVQYQVANIRTLVPRPHFISLYVTAFIIEQLINHKCILDIYGTNEDVYHCVNGQVSKIIPLA